MIKKVQIEQLVNRAEATFVDCWGLISSMKMGKLQEYPLASLTDFQPMLATTIFELCRLYRVIEQEKIDRVRHKKSYSKKWFRARMYFLSKQQDVLNKTISVGKGIGDAFVWFFYQRDRHYLAEHLALQTQHHTPPGIGGAGELEFIKNIQKLQGYFILYHGNTNILRLGDLTLIDLATFRVAGIGELKSRSLELGKLNITLLISGPNLNIDILENDTSKPRHAKGVGEVAGTLTASGQDRLNRQIKRISNSFKKLGGMPDKKVKLEIDGQIDSLAKFITGLKPGRFSFQQFGKSLLLVGYKEPNKSLYKKLSTTDPAHFATRLSGIEASALKLISNDRNDNSLVIDSFFYDKNGNSRHIPGMTHFVWWPLAQEAAKSVVFQDVMIFTIFNPVHFMAALEAAGFTVEETGKLNWQICKTCDGHKLAVDGMNYYLAMIQHYLFSEDEIVAFIRDSAELIGNSSSGKPQRVELLIEQKFETTKGT